MIKTPTQARTAAALVLLSLVLVGASSAPLVSAADSWLQATYTPAVVAAPGALVPVVPAPHSITWATGPRVGTECNGLISNGTLPLSTTHDRICVSVRVGAGPYVDAYLSLYSRSKNTPIAVFFRLPDGGGQVSAPSRVSWPATARGHINSWDPSSTLVHMTSTPGEWSDVKSFELADRTMTVEGYQTKVLQTRGHMASFAAFTGSQAKQQATMSYANAFPSFNSITGLAGTRYFDGNVWNARETATIALANTLAANALYVVVGTDFGEAIHRVLIDGAVPIRARPTFGNLYATASVVPVPARVWTAIYDSAGDRGFAWICEHRDHRKGEVYHALYAPHGSATPTCTYVSIDQIAIDFGIDPFPGVAAGPARTNASPAGFAGVWNPPAARGNYHGLVNQPLPAGTILTGGKLFWW